MISIPGNGTKEIMTIIQQIQEEQMIHELTFWGLGSYDG
jgi:hypothetical protein